MDFSDSNMLPIPVHELIGGVQVPVDLHVKLGEGKYIVIAKAGTYTQIERFQTYQEKQVEVLYVRKEDYHAFVSQSVKVMSTVIVETDLALPAKASLLSQAASSVLAELKTLGLSNESYDHARKVAENTLLLVERDLDLLEVFAQMNSGTPWVFEHSVAVSALSVMIAKKQGWTKRLTLEKVALGGLLHDIGMRELPADLLEKPRSKMTSDEIKLYESHPFRGLELLRAIKSAPDDVAAMVYEHHENAIGQGYPRRLKDARINPLSRVVAVANAFIDVTIAPVGVRPMTPREAIHYLEHVMGQPFNKDAFRALCLVVLQEGRKAS